MYAALWRVLPGPVWLRILILAVLLAVVLFVLAEWIFPWIQSLTPDPDGTVGNT
jgi:uncharacterized BrkB/YihY/UPF0761 family membrane protein